jgi:hypothetical protein
MMCGRGIGEHGMNTADICNMFIEGDPDEIIGHKTFDTGERDEHGFPKFRHEPLTRSEVNALWEASEAAKRSRVERMPDEKAAINALFDAWQRLKELGWNDPQYCPKDGSNFKVIELGSTGIFDCHYQGKWPDGLYMVSDERDVYPTSTGVAMYRLLPDDEEKRKQKLAEAGALYRALKGEPVPRHEREWKEKGTSPRRD